MSNDSLSSMGPLSRIESAALRSIQERPQHFQLVVGGMRVIRSLERRGLVTLRSDLYVAVVAS